MVEGGVTRKEATGVGVQGEDRRERAVRPDRKRTRTERGGEGEEGTAPALNYSEIRGAECRALIVFSANARGGVISVKITFICSLFCRSRCSRPATTRIPLAPSFFLLSFSRHPLHLSRVCVCLSFFLSSLSLVSLFSRDALALSSHFFASRFSER